MNRCVSVIIPAWNMGQFLRDAVASIPDVLEIIVVVADSEDDTLEVANELVRERPGVSVLENPKKIPASGRNIGLRHAHGDIIAFIDADDVWPRDRLALQLERLDRHPPADVVAGLAVYFDKLDRAALAPASDARVETRFIQGVPTMIFRRSVFEQIGDFDESLTYGEDADLILRIVEANIPFAILNTPTLYYRRHGNSMMNRDLARQKSDFARVVGLSLARRRRLGLSVEPLSFDRYFEELKPGSTL